jgi:hypothetical protein
LAFRQFFLLCQYITVVGVSDAESAHTCLSASIYDKPTIFLVCSQPYFAWCVAIVLEYFGRWKRRIES